MSSSGSIQAVTSDKPEETFLHYSYLNESLLNTAFLFT